MTIGVLVTNYDSWALAMECITANICFCGSNLSQIVLVDDCSRLPVPELSGLPVELIRNQSNLGFAKSLNIGIAQLNTDIIVIFDADARPLHDYTDRMLREFTQDTSLALLGFRTVDEEDKPTTSYDTEPGTASLILGQALHLRLKSWVERKETRICITTCAMAIRKAALKDIIGFDEQLDWLDVDLDFSMNINRSQWKLKVASELVAFHKGGGTPMLTANRVLKFYQNRWYLLRKYGKVRHPRIAKGIILARLYLEYLLLALAGKFLTKSAASRVDKLAGRRRIITYCKNHY